MLTTILYWTAVYIAYYYGKSRGYEKAELSRLKDELEFMRADIRVGDKVRLSADGSGVLVTVTETNIRMLVDQIGRGVSRKE